MPRRLIAILLAVAWLAAPLGAPAGAAEPEPLDWSRFESLPVFDGGRIMPLDTFARRVVREITGRSAPTLGPPETPAEGAAAALFPDGQARRFAASELLFEWLVEPEVWENVAFLPAGNEALRGELLGLPLRGPGGERLRYVSPAAMEKATRLWERFDELARQEQAAHVEGRRLKLTATDEAVAALGAAYRSFRVLTFDPGEPAGQRDAFLAQLDEVVDLWRRGLAPRLAAWRGQEGQDELAQAINHANKAVERLTALARGPSFTLAEAEPPVVQLREATAKLADDFAAKRDRAFQAMRDNSPMVRSARAMVNAMAAQTAQLARLAASLEVSLWENGHPSQPAQRTLRLVPALDAHALEADRDTGLLAPPWLSWARLMRASKAATAGYPAPELAAVRRAFADVKAAYLDRDAPERPRRFAEAMDRFADAVGVLGEAIEPARRRLPVEKPDEELLARTAYPPAGFGRMELHYNRLDPFLWAWVLTAAALGVLALGVGRARTPLFVVGLVVLAAAQAAAVWGLWLRGAITGMVPVANMYETVLFVGITVAVLGLWFAVAPLVWPGLEPAWRLSAFPWTGRGKRTDAEDQKAVGGAAWSAGRWLVAPVRVGLIGYLVYLLAFANLGPEGRPILSFDIALGSLGPGAALGLVALALVGLALVGWTLWFVPRAVLAAILGVVLVPVELARHGVRDPLKQAVARRWMLLAGAAVALLAYLVAYFAPGEVFDRDVGTGMTAILRNNFWLALHVLVVTASYGAGALGWGLANVALACYAFGRYRRGPDLRDPSPEICAVLAGQIYRAVQVAVLLLAAGTITGAIWADHAWGRYWGWDPKEIGALVTLLVYLVVLHGRWAGWMGHFALAAGAVAGAPAILATWYGVNFVFTGGLHSYGEGSGGTTVVGACLVANWLLVAVASIRHALELPAADVAGSE